MHMNAQAASVRKTAQARGEAVPGTENRECKTQGEEECEDAGGRARTLANDRRQGGTKRQHDKAEAHRELRPQRQKAQAEDWQRA